MPTLKLTKRALEAAQPSSAPYELRDKEVIGFLCKVTPKGRKTFMLQYRTVDGTKRKPAIGLFGDLTVEQARAIAQKWLSEVRNGRDPSKMRMESRRSMSVAEFCELYYSRHTLVNNKKRTQQLYRGLIDRHIKRRIGSHKIDVISKKDMIDFVDSFQKIPATAFVCMNFLTGMFTHAAKWGYRTEDTHPCRGVRVNVKRKRPRLIPLKDLARIMDFLELPEIDGGVKSTYSIAIRLQFAFAARVSEILQLQWDWVDLDNRRISWPDSKTGPMWKPISAEAHQLLCLAAKTLPKSAFVVSRCIDQGQPIAYINYVKAWKRVLKATENEYVGTHGIRHRAATDIANSGIPIKVGMALTGHRKLDVFMAYVHVEEPQIFEAVDRVAEVRAKKLAELRLKE